MESSWRRNVIDWGLGDLGIGLAARMLDLPNWCVTDQGQPSFFAFNRFTIRTDPWLVVVGVPQLKAIPGSNFPYGIPVEPDTPL